LLFCNNPIYLVFFLGTSGTGSGFDWPLSSVRRLLSGETTGVDPAGFISAGDKSVMEQITT
jgi:hypothetical protein